MLFNSYSFICLFLPITLAGFWLIGRVAPKLVPLWLVAASLFFYGWWNPAYLALLLLSISANYLAGTAIGQHVGKVQKISLADPNSWLIIIAVGANLALLGYYKYANFFINNLNSVLNYDWAIGSVILPLGISFFTFTQIAFLVDVFQGKVKEYNFVNYCLFVTYFPHLIAGPVLHHQEMMPQFKRLNTQHYQPEIAGGLTILAIGLAKKVLLADGIVNYATVIFEAVREHYPLTFAEAWLGALAYTLQLYFDFSGYSDMAIGISLLFGVTLPINFNSPYKAVNMIDFWRRWHITLSNFLRDYLYIPLGGNRHGEFRRYFNLLLTMLLGGLWHGAGWTFIVWGGLHGVYLVINHTWQGIRKSWGHDLKQISLLGRIWSTALTFIAVIIAWVFFRAETLTGAIEMLDRMFQLPTSSADLALNLIQAPSEAIVWIGTLLVIVFFLPNTQEIMSNKFVFSEVIRVKSKAIVVNLSNVSVREILKNKEISYFWIGSIAPLILLMIMIAESQVIKEFIYFNF
jgi:alginate O-acetyltransferase complex protein AlgI